MLRSRGNKFTSLDKHVTSLDKHVTSLNKHVTSLDRLVTSLDKHVASIYKHAILSFLWRHVVDMYKPIVFLLLNILCCFTRYLKYFKFIPRYRYLLEGFGKNKTSTMILWNQLILHLII
jgi:sRNA-binding regulator protein Hfq